MRKRTVIRNKIIDVRDSQAIMQALRLRYFSVGQSVYDINMVLSELEHNEVVIVSTYINNQIAGSAYVKCLTLDNGEDVLLLDNLFVRSDLKNKGLELKLILYVLSSKEALNKFFNKNCQRLIVNPAFNGNKGFYSQIGFEDIDDNFMGRKI